MKNNNLKLKAYVSTNVGKVRTNNEDNFLFFGKIVDDMQTQLSYKDKTNLDVLSLFGVFDGMGGHAYGEKASYITADFAKNFYLDENRMEEGLSQICLQANQLVCMEMRELKQRIGSTASMMAFLENQAYVCNIGDTPIFRFRDGVLEELHEEHTERKMYEKLYGETNPKKKYRLTQNIGVFEEEMLIKPYVTSLEIQEGDQYLICSDGLTDMVEQAFIQSVLSQKDDSTKLSLLEEAALNAGGKDNITMILIIIEKKSLLERLRK